MYKNLYNKAQKYACGGTLMTSRPFAGR